jgi:hypothetical protein
VTASEGKTENLAYEVEQPFKCGFRGMAISVPK